MQAIIKYNLNNHEEKIAFDQAMKSDDLVLALIYLSRRLANKMKEKELNEYAKTSIEFQDGYDEAVCDASMIINEVLERFNINLNHLEK
jgi:hypothetical protein